MQASQWFSFNGLEISTPVFDGKIHRINRNAYRDKSAWYIAWDEPFVVILAGDWRTGERWKYSARGEMTRTEERAAKARLEIAIAERAAEIAAGQQAAALRADITLRSLPTAGKSPYLERKQVRAFGLRFDGGDILMPMHDVKGRIWGYQRISPDGKKLFLSGQKARGTFHMIGEARDVFIVCEGYATGASLHMATGHTVACALFASNLAPVAAAIIQTYPGAHVVIAADNDQWTPSGNTGVKEALRVARGLSLYVAIPEFDDETSKPTDFNDLHLLQGLDAVRLCVENSTEFKRPEVITEYVARIYDQLMREADG